MARWHLSFLLASVLCYQQYVVAQRSPIDQTPTAQLIRIRAGDVSSDVTSYPFSLSGGTSGDTTQMLSFKGNLLPMSDAAENRTEAFTGPLYVAGTANSTAIPANSITLISCDTSAYPGNLQADDVLQTALSREAGSIIWFTTERDLCNVDPDFRNQGLLYTMTSAMHADRILEELTGANETVLGTITRSSANETAMPNEPSTSNRSPLAPGPSTAVAMIILYCVTAIVTALFLVIIVTGAIRAHRHPERYGRQVDAAGQQRQSRAKGIARAMLDTIPIVKFGERENANANANAEGTEAATKRGDIEMGATSSAAATEGNAATALTDAASDDQNRPSNPADTEMTGATTAATAAAGSAATRTSTDDPNRISAAPSAPTAVDIAASVPDDTLGCSICTDDFERGQDIRVLPCSHRFHPACIDPWLLNVSGTCPLCRIDLRDPDRSASDPTAPSATDNDTENLDPPHPTDRDTSNANPRRHSRLSFLLHPNPRIPPYQIRARNRGSTAITPASPPLANEAGAAEDVQAEASTASGEAETRRRRRITMRLQETFGIRTRRHSVQPATNAEAETQPLEAPSGLSTDTGSVGPASATGPVTGEEATASTMAAATNSVAQITESQEQPPSTARPAEPQRSTSATSASGRPIQMSPFLRSD